MLLRENEYNEIKKIYDDRRLSHAYELEDRKREIFAKIPGFKDLEDQVISLSMEYGRNLLKCKNNPDEKTKFAREYHENILNIKMEKNRMLKSHGYPHDYLEMRYDCIKCQDTGYIDNERCQCLRRIEAQYLYSSSHLSQILESNNFSCLSRDYYTGNDLIMFDRAVDTCKNFINNFNSDYRNLLFYGTVGTGKSFLSGCVAKELMDRGCSIIYFSASGLFQMISSHIYEKDKEFFNELIDTLYDCDLLIIDDLGTEVTNDFVRSQFFNIINERAVRRKSVIISTNLSLEGLRENYSDRVFSRVYESYELVKLSVYKDIRLQKRLAMQDN